MTVIENMVMLRVSSRKHREKEMIMVKAIRVIGEEIQDFFMVSAFGPAAFVLGVMALFGFGGPALASLFH